MIEIPNPNQSNSLWKDYLDDIIKEYWDTLSYAVQLQIYELALALSNCEEEEHES